MSFSSESKFDHEGDDSSTAADDAANVATPVVEIAQDDQTSSNLHYRRSRSSSDRMHQQRPPQRRSRYTERLYHRHPRSDIATGTATATTPATTATPDTLVNSGSPSPRSFAAHFSSTRYRSRRATAASETPTITDHEVAAEELPSSSFMELFRQPQPRGFDFNTATGDDVNNGVDDDVEEDDEEYEDEEVDDYDEEEEEDEEMDDGSTAVTIRAPTDRRSSSTPVHPIWASSVAGIVSAGSSTDMGGADGAGITSQASMATATSASVAPNNTDGTEHDELLVGSGSSADGGDTTVAASSTNNTSLIVSAVPNLQSLFGKQYLREIGSEDILSFQLSSAKPGNGVEQLYDPSYETYWQSDGTCQPHWIQIQLPRRLPVSHVALYLDYQLDESYTPRTVQIETGLTVVQDSSQTNHSTIVSDAPIMELHEPVGWCIFPIYVPPDPFDTINSENSNNVGVINQTTMIPRAHWIRVSILSMHQNGRDTHVRRVALFCQRSSMTIRMPPQHQHVSRKLPHKEVTKTIEDKDADGADHEEILMYARTRSTLRNYDPSTLSQSICTERHSNLFATLR